MRSGNKSTCKGKRVYTTQIYMDFFFRWQIHQMNECLPLFPDALFWSILLLVHSSTSDMCCFYMPLPYHFPINTYIYSSRTLPLSSSSQGEEEEIDSFLLIRSIMNQYKQNDQGCRICYLQMSSIFYDMQTSRRRWT